MSRGLCFYIHIPYCTKRCGYCDFNTYTPSELNSTLGLIDLTNNYVELVLKEISLARAIYPVQSQIPTIFFGGGTPSLIEPAGIGRILDRLKSEFGLMSDVEITLEANPDTLTKERLAQYREVGVNRLSIGMQSAVPHVLAALDRTHRPEGVVSATQWAHEVGFDNVSVDLIYGTPGESLKDWELTMDVALSLPIQHISAYALIVESGTKLAQQVRRGEVVIPDDDETADKYLAADARFSRHGLTWYELSNWGEPSRHNMMYWMNGNWWGIGPGAHSHIDGQRWWNVKHPTMYRERLESGNSPEHDREILSEEEKARERIMLGIRLAQGLEVQTLSPNQRDVARLFVGQGSIDPVLWESGRLVLTLQGRLIADRIVREMVV